MDRRSPLPLSGDVTLSKISVGPMDNNAYLLTAEDGGAVLIDAAEDDTRLLELIDGREVAVIVTTHRHGDHWQALPAVAEATEAELICGRPDVDAIATGAWVEGLVGVWDGDEVTIGDGELEVIGLVGHTPGSIALAFTGTDGVVHLFTGDSLFPGGPGKTEQPGRLRLPDGRPGDQDVRPLRRPHGRAPRATATTPPWERSGRTSPSGAPAAGERRYCGQALPQLRRQQPTGPDQPGRHHHGDRLGRQQPDQHQQLSGTGLDRGAAAEQHPDEGSGQGHQTDRPGLVQTGHQRFRQVPADHLVDRLRPGQSQGQSGLVRCPARRAGRRTPVDRSASWRSSRHR